ncbi:MAG: class I SAM-dependent methyltransferase [Actinomycetia bacterium]|nr:class I SAM-dependent methyltransferase [Actinomycetes bacterium]
MTSTAMTNIKNSEHDVLETPAADVTAADAPAAPADVIDFADEYGDPVRYDLEYGTAGLDIAFYLALAEQADGPVLDIATGTGRIALALTEAGHEVTAVDVNEAMVDFAIAKDADETVTWVVQDARELKARGKFGLAIVAGNALQQLLTNDDRTAALKAIYRQLAPGATFAFAIRFPHVAELARRVETPEIWHSYTDVTGSQVVVSGTQRYDAASQVMTHETYRQYAVDGTPAAAPTTTAVRYSFPQELEAALAAVCFEVEGTYVDFVGTPLTDQSAATASALVYVCRKPETTKR